MNQYLQVDGLTNVFALGDCCNTVERKMAVYAGKQAECVVANIVAEAGGKQVNLRECYQGCILSRYPPPTLKIEKLSCDAQIFIFPLIINEECNSYQYILMIVLDLYMASRTIVGFDLLQIFISI